MRALRTATAALVIAGLLGAWEAVARAEWINIGLFSTPLLVLEELWRLLIRTTDGRSVLLAHYGATLWRLVLAFFIGASIGFIIGLATGLNRIAYRFFDPLITVLMPIPGIALAPLFIVWLGFGDVTIVAVGAIAAFFPIVHNVSAGLRSIDRHLLHAARIMGASTAAIVFQVYLPWSAVHLLTGVRLGLVKCWRTVIAVEFVAAASWGLGFMVWDAAEYLNAAVVYGGILLMALTFVFFDNAIIRPAERITIEKWGMLREN